MFLYAYALAQVRDATWIGSRIRRAERKVEDESLEEDVRRRNGTFTGGRERISEIKVDMSGHKSWHNKLLGQIVVGIFIAVCAGIILALLGI